jgi:hypothetical protein
MKRFDASSSPIEKQMVIITALIEATSARLSSGSSLLRLTMAGTNLTLPDESVSRSSFL